MAEPDHKVEIRNLKSEIQRLKQDNRRLAQRLEKARTEMPVKQSVFFRKLAIIISAALAVGLLFAGNILFWAGNTIVKTDRYADTVQPLIREPEIQDAISTYATSQLYESVDIEQITEEALPPRAVFLAPSLAEKIQENTKGVINKGLASPRLQDKWNEVQVNAHSRFISNIKEHGSGGAIDINEFYQQINDDLKTTRLAFLADKSLPPKVGEIKVVEGAWISKLQTLINNIDTWRTIAILLLLAFSATAIWLSRNRRKTVRNLGLLFAAAMFITLVIIRISREVIASKVDDMYSAAAAEATQTILYPLAVQTATLLVLGLIIAFVAWISGPSRSAEAVSTKIRLLFGGKLHRSLFSSENSFTLWVGRNKRLLQWAMLGVILILLLFIRLTPGTLAAIALSALIAILAIEAVAADNG